MSRLPSDPSESFAALMDDQPGRGERRRVRTRRRRRRIMRGIVRFVSWTLVLAGVFVLGLGYGRTIGAGDEQRTDTVVVTDEIGTLEATLPTRTVTVVRTVTQPARRTPAGRAAAQRATAGGAR